MYNECDDNEKMLTNIPEEGIECTFWEALKYIAEDYNGGWLLMSRDDWNYNDFVCLETNAGGNSSEEESTWSTFLSYLAVGSDKAVPWNPTNDDIFNHTWFIHS
jgi:hypothetical protein